MSEFSRVASFSPLAYNSMAVVGVASYKYYTNQDYLHKINSSTEISLKLMNSS